MGIFFRISNDKRLKSKEYQKLGMGLAAFFYLLKILNSVLLFNCLPSSVSFGAMGC